MKNRTVFENICVMLSMPLLCFFRRLSEEEIEAYSRRSFRSYDKKYAFILNDDDQLNLDEIALMNFLAVITVLLVSACIIK